MKKIFVFLSVALAAVTMFSSCEDMELLQEHPKQANAKSFMTNAETVRSEINAIYFQMHRTEAYGRYFSVLNEALCDYCYGRGNYATSYATGLTSGGTKFSNDSWAVMYRCVRFANDLMRQIGDVPLSTREYEELTGEIRFLRALAYSNLVKYWGGVPFFTEKDMDDFNKPRTDAATIWNYIIEECKYAVEKLPLAVTEIGRPSRYAADMLLGEALLYQKKYAEAQAAFEDVISSGAYSIVPVYTADEFSKVYGVTLLNSPEEIFYMKYNVDVMSKFFWMFVCSPNPVRNTGALGIYTDIQDNKFIASWDQDDLRKQYSIWRQTGNGTLKGLTSTDASGVCNGAICLKYRDPESSGEGSSNDFPLYRYADALLYAAEARCMAAGAPDETAMEYVNTIRRRAYGLVPTAASAKDYKLSDYDTKEKFMELVLKERGYETCFEGKRYCDLKRLGKLADAALAAGKIQSVEEVKDAAYWWPIPTDEFNYNNALDPTTDQNPGY